MRNEFIKKLIELAKIDQRIVLLTADLGFSVVEEFAKNFPDRFYNVGVSEQNMVGLATGLAKDGFIPFVYSIAPFVLLRPFEFVRNGPVFHRLPVRFVGIGCGFEYGTLGSTHHLLEDIALVRSQPGFMYVAPSNDAQTPQALEKTYQATGPIFYRIGKGSTKILEQQKEFNPQQLQIVQSGEKVVLFSLGAICAEAEIAVKNLLQKNIKITFAAIPTFEKPVLDEIKNLLQKHDLVITLESHYSNGGIGSMIAEIIAENGINCRLKKMAVKKLSDGIYGSEKFLYQKNNLDSESVEENIFNYFLNESCVSNKSKF
jgi:transketolase